MRRLYFLIGLIVLILLVFTFGCSKGDPEIKRFAGTYSGTYSGDSSGTWTAIFKQDGTVTASVTEPEIGTFKGIGKIDATGKFAFSTSGKGIEEVSVISWEGIFKIENGIVTGKGTWRSSTGPGGTWEGKRQ